MITELEKGMLLGYLTNAPDEIKGIASLLLTKISNNDKKEKLLNSLASECLELSLRTSRTITEDGIKTVRDLVRKSERDMLRIPNFGRKALNEIKGELMEKGLRFGMPNE